MTTTLDLNALIIEKADKEHAAIAEKNRQSIVTILNPIYYDDVIIEWNGKLTVPVNVIIAALHKALCEKTQPTFREQAIKNFAAKVESLSAQIEELQNSIQ